MTTKKMTAWHTYSAKVRPDYFINRIIDLISFITIHKNNQNNKKNMEHLGIVFKIHSRNN